MIVTFNCPANIRRGKTIFRCWLWNNLELHHIASFQLTHYTNVLPFIHWKITNINISISPRNKYHRVPSEVTFVKTWCTKNYVETSDMHQRLVSQWFVVVSDKTSFLIIMGHYLKLVSFFIFFHVSWRPHKCGPCRWQCWLIKH